MTGPLLSILSGILLVLISLNVTPVVASSTTTFIQDRQFACSGGTSGNEYTVLCRLTGTFTKSPANARTLTVLNPVQQTAGDASDAPSGGSTFTVSGTKAAAAGTVAWTPSVGMGAISIGELVPLIFGAATLIAGTALLATGIYTGRKLIFR